jgi:hypothetical protein
LSTFLVEMLYDMDPEQPERDSAYGRQVYRHSINDRSPTIRELFDRTALKPMRHKGPVNGLYSRDLSRLGGSVFDMMRAGDMDADLPPGLKRPGDEEDDGAGVSIFLIETRAD